MWTHPTTNCPPASTRKPADKVGRIAVTACGQPFIFPCGHMAGLESAAPRQHHTSAARKAADNHTAQRHTKQKGWPQYHKGMRPTLQGAVNVGLHLRGGHNLRFLPTLRQTTTAPAPPYPVGASRVKRFAPGFKTPICLSPAPLARGEFGGAWGGPFGTGFRAAPGRLFFGYFLLATQKKVPRRRAESGRQSRRAAAHKTKKVGSNTITACRQPCRAR